MLTEYKRKGDILIAYLNGELDHHHAEKIRQSIDKQLTDTSIRHLVLNLKNLHFMDSSGIGVFIGRYKTIKKRGGQVCITEINPQLKRILEVSGLYRILKEYETVEHAVHSIRGVSV